MKAERADTPEMRRFLRDGSLQAAANYLARMHDKKQFMLHGPWYLESPDGLVQAITQNRLDLEMAEKAIAVYQANLEDENDTSTDNPG